MNLAIPKQPQVLAPDFIKWVKSQVCIVCQAPNPDPHHVIGHGLSGVAMKADDHLTIPLCNKHHTGDQGVHRGHESWEHKFGCQLEMAARTLIYAYANSVITPKLCSVYLSKLEPFIGMDYIHQVIGSYPSTEKRGIRT